MTTQLALCLFLLAASGMVAGVALGMARGRRELRRVVRYRLGL